MKVNNFVIDRILRGIMTSTADGSYMWSINQIQEPALNITSETAEAVDALGSRIAVFNRGKSAEFTANNSIFDLGLFAAQNGVSVQEAGAGAGESITTPMFEEITVTGAVTYTLSETPTTAPSKLYKLNGDGTLGTAYTKDASASASTFFVMSSYFSLITFLSSPIRFSSILVISALIKLLNFKISRLYSSSLLLFNLLYIKFFS